MKIHNTIIILVLLIWCINLREKLTISEKNLAITTILKDFYRAEIKRLDSINTLNNIHIKSLHHLLNYKPLRHLKPKADSINKLYNHSNN